MEIVIHQGERYAIDPHAVEKIKQHILMNGGCCRKVYNLYTDYLYKHLEESGYENGPMAKIKLPEVTFFKEQYPFLKEADSLGLANVKEDFEAAIKKFNEQENQTAYRKSAIRKQQYDGTVPTFRDLKGMPRFHSKKENRYSYTTNCQISKNGKPTVWLDGNDLHVPKLDVNIPLIMHRPLPAGSAIKNVTLGMEPDDILFVSINVEYTRTIDTTIRDIGVSEDMIALGKLRFLGLDYDQNDFYVDSEGEKANYPKFYRKSEEKLAKLQKQLSRMQRGSKNYNRQLRRIQKLHLHIANERKDFLQKLSTQLVRDYDVIVVEDINLRALSQTLHLAKNLEDNGFGMFRDMLSCKLERKGSLLVKIPKYYASSKTCSNCGHIEKSVVLGVDKWICPVCKKEHDRDVNAAINIKYKGIEIFAEFCKQWQEEHDKADKRRTALRNGRRKTKADGRKPKHRKAA